MWNFVSVSVLVLATIGSDSDQSWDQILTYMYDNSVLSEMHALQHTFHALSNFFHVWSETSKAIHWAKQAKKKPQKQVSEQHTAFNYSICLCQLIPVSYMCSFLLLPKGQLKYVGQQQLFVTLLQVSLHASSLPFPTSPFLSPCSSNCRGSFSPLYCFSAGWEALQVSRSC